MFKLIEWIGERSVASLRRSRIEPTSGGDEADESAAETAPPAELEQTDAPTPVKSLFRSSLLRYFRQATEWPQTWWQARQTDPALLETTIAADPEANPPLPMTSPVVLKADSRPAAADTPMGRHAARIEPVFNLQSDQQTQYSARSDTDPAVSLPPAWELPSGLDMLTLVPTAAPIVCGSPDDTGSFHIPAKAFCETGFRAGSWGDW